MEPQSLKYGDIIYIIYGEQYIGIDDNNLVTVDNIADARRFKLQEVHVVEEATGCEDCDDVDIEVNELKHSVFSLVDVESGNILVRDSNGYIVTRSSNNSIISIFIAQRNGFTVNTPQTMLNITIQNSNYYCDQVNNIKSDDDQVSCGGDWTVNSDNIIRATISGDLFSFWTFEELRKLQEEIDRGKRIEDIIKGNENGDIIGNVPYVDPDYDAFLNNDDGDGNNNGSSNIWIWIIVIAVILIILIIIGIIIFIVVKKKKNAK